MNRKKKAPESTGPVINQGYELVATSALKPHPRNVNRGDLVAIGDSIIENGFYGAIVAQKSTGFILAGNHRFEAAKTAGVSEVPVIWVDVNDDRALRILLADNRTTRLGHDDQAELAALLKEILDESETLAGTGYDEAALDALLAEVGVTECEPQTDEDEIPASASFAVTEPGDVWIIGKHRLLCGDSKSVDDWKRVMDGQQGDMLITDPPYGVSYADKNRFLNAISRGNRIQKPIHSDHKTPEEMSEFWNEVFASIRTILKPGAAYYVTGPQGGDLLLLLLQSLNQCDFPLRHMLIWAKNNHVLGRCDYHYKHEPIIYGWVEGAGHKFYGGHGETSLWEIAKPQKSDLHPTMKPVELYERAIRNSSQVNETVVDGFGGSGTVVIACEKTNRRARAMEIDPHYCDVIVKRWQDFTGKEAVLESDGRTFNEIAAQRQPEAVAA